MTLDEALKALADRAAEWTPEALDRVGVGLTPEALAREARWLKRWTIQRRHRANIKRRGWR